MVYPYSGTSWEEIDKAAIFGALSYCSQRITVPIQSYCMKSAFLLHTVRFTLLIDAPSSLSEVVTAHIEHASVFLFVLHYQCLQMGDAAQYTIS